MHAAYTHVKQCTVIMYNALIHTDKLGDSDLIVQ